MAVRGLGCPVRFTLTAGKKGDAPQAADLIKDLPAKVVMADTAYDSDALRQAIDDKDAIAVIPNSPSRAFKHPLDNLRGRIFISRFSRPARHDADFVPIWTAAIISHWTKARSYAFAPIREVSQLSLRKDCSALLRPAPRPPFPSNNAVCI